MKTLAFKTKTHQQVIDITSPLAEQLKSLENQQGIVHLFLLHTTAALTVADLDPGTDLDLLDAFREMIPKLAYRHAHDPGHVPDHILSCLIGPSLCVPVRGGEFVLGTWQRIILIEFAGPRERQIAFSYIS
ncbi:MAG TPA: secondary thiamine-phosphate synthase enzyme YjbQ [Terriglobales bacterium]|nr:secondary thiamine-phosphate synthase enzyme YjbQ [Terriglobales bacterium]